MAKSKFLTTKYAEYPALNKTWQEIKSGKMQFIVWIKVSDVTDPEITEMMEVVDKSL